MFSFLYAPLPDVKAYLDRIQTDRSPEVSKEYLDYLIYKHQLNVPFENIDINVYKKQADLGIEALFEKIVTNKRGGVCFELNALFYSLLEAIGFHVYPCLAKVLLGIPSDKTPGFHRGNIVELDGKLYFCDVGFGGPQPSFAVELNGEIQEKNHERFRAVKAPITKDNNDWWRIDMFTVGEEFLSVMLIQARPYDQIDFLAPSYFICDQNQKLVDRFTAFLLLNIKREDGNASLTNDEFKKNIRGEFTDIKVDGSEEVIRDIAETFKLPVELIRDIL